MSAMFFHSYLFAFVFWSSFALGSSSLLMIYQLTGGEWGKTIEEILIAATRTIYSVIVLFIPIFFGIEKIYSWAGAGYPLTEKAKQQSQYLNPMAFGARSLFYFFAWSCLAFFLVRWSQRLRDNPEDEETRSKLKALSAGGLVLYGFTVSFAAIDWVMSLEPSWYSTVYGLVYLVAQGISAFSFVIFILPWVITDQLSKKVLSDLGNILLAFIMLWAYVSALQYVIIWSGNIPEEALWFNHRRHGGWGYLITLTAVFQFAGPFLVLLFKNIKRNLKFLSMLGLGLLLIRSVDVFWFVMPAFHPEGFTLHLTDVALFLTVGAVWLGSFTWSFKRG